MALIDCKECGNKVSDKAQACPKCGAPVELDQPQAGTIPPPIPVTAPEPPKYVAPEEVEQPKVGVVPPPIPGAVPEPPKCEVSEEVEQPKVGAVPPPPSIPEPAPEAPKCEVPEEVEQPKVGVVPPPPSMPEATPEAPKCEVPEEEEQPKIEEVSSPVLENESEEEPKKKKSKVGLFCGIGVLIVAIIVALFLLVPDLRFWEDTKRSSRSHSDDSDDDVEYCERDSATKRDYVAIRDTAPERKPSMKVQEVRDLSGIYVGNVGKSEVQMTLSQSNNYVSGSYIYTNVGNELTLTGYFNGEEITLSETTPKGNYSATWTLYPTSNGLEGSMYVYHTQKTHNVTLTRID